jgi:hypothetical protein
LTYSDACEIAQTSFARMSVLEMTHGDTVSADLHAFAALDRLFRTTGRCL